MRVQRFVACLRGEGEASRGARMSCRESLGGVTICFTSHKVCSVQSMKRLRLRNCLDCVREKRFTSSAVSEGMTSVHTLFRCLCRRGEVRESPSLRLGPPGIRGQVPRVLAISRMSHLLGRPSLGAPGKVQSDTVLRLLCTAKVHIDRLLQLGLRSLGLQLNCMIYRSRSGRQIVPVKGMYGATVRGCLGRTHKGFIGRGRARDLFAGYSKGSVDERKF